MSFIKASNVSLRWNTSKWLELLMVMMDIMKITQKRNQNILFALIVVGSSIEPTLPHFNDIT